MTELTAPWHAGPIVGFDVETTGVDVENDRIVTATVVWDVPGYAPVRHNWLIDPGIEIPAEAAEIHKITTEHARAHGRPPVVVVPEIVETLAYYLCGSPAPLVIYNAPFDHTLLYAECRRYGVTSIFERASSVGTAVWTIDPLVIDKAGNPYVKGKGQRKLTPTCARYGVTLDNAHNSEADVVAAIALARKQAQAYPQVGAATLEKLHEWQVRWHTAQTHSFADFLLRLRTGKSPEECLELETKAAGVRAEAGQWPIRPYEVPVPQA
jgi:DNA polymerase-3 subunit epsilon